MNIFERATKGKLRFNTIKGNCSVEDLWDLPLTNTKGLSLDHLAMEYYKKLQESETKSFVTKVSNTNTETKLKFDIVKHIIDVKMEAQEAETKRLAKKAQKDQIMGIIARKQDEALEGKSIDELQKIMDEL